MHGRSAKGKPPLSRPAAPRREGFGPQPLGALIAPLLRPVVAKRGTTKAELIAEWPAIVGPRLADLTTPRRLTAGTLTLACTGAAALELQHSAAALIERINTHLGRKAVERLRFKQDLLLPLAATLPPIAPETEAAIAAQLAGFPPSPLRDALAALARALHRAGKA